MIFLRPVASMMRGRTKCSRLRGSKGASCFILTLSLNIQNKLRIRIFLYFLAYINLNYNLVNICPWWSPWWTCPSHTQYLLIAEGENIRLVRYLVLDTRIVLEFNQQMISIFSSINSISFIENYIYINKINLRKWDLIWWKIPNSTMFTIWRYSSSE